MENYNKILRGIQDFPTLPTIYSVLSDVVANPRSTAKDVANIIMQDQSAASKVLAVANSAIYGFRGKIDTISQAIFYIGFNEVKNIVLSLSIMDIFKTSTTLHNYNPVELWKHSIAVGVVTRILGTYLEENKPENYFISGILHDIGKLLFLRYCEKDYSKTIDYAYDNSVNIRDAEAKIMGTTHTVVGELIAEKWKLPTSIKNAIKNHYTGTINGKVDRLTGCVHISNIVVRLFELGESGDDIIPIPNIDVWNELELPPVIFNQITSKILSNYEESLVLFSLY